VDGDRDDQAVDRAGFEVEVVDGAPAVVALTGELDLATAPVLVEALERLAGDVVLDCAGLDFVDSSGLSVIVADHRRRVRAGRQLSLRRLSPAIYQTFEITGLHHELDLAPPSPG
jgi:anti-anti-sigma factor